MNSTYVSSLRERQKADTRALILETVERSLLAAVAREAGITERTMYRHFATRGQLLEATWAAVNEAIGVKACKERPADLTRARAHTALRGGSDALQRRGRSRGVRGHRGTFESPGLTSHDFSD
jgi:AcrR family transcriptional regulator